MGGKKGMSDHRFLIEHADDPAYSLVTRSSDGQMLFLANKLSKMKRDTPLGSRIAEVHNGSSLFTGSAGTVSAALFVRCWLHRKGLLVDIRRLPPDCANYNQNKPFRYSPIGPQQPTHFFGG